MRVIQVLGRIIPSGPVLHVKTLAHALVQLSLDVNVMTPADPEAASRVLGPLALRQLPVRGFPMLRAIPRLAQIAREQPHTLLHAHLTRPTYLAYGASLLSRVAIVATVHTVTHDPVFRWVARRKGRLIAVSNFVQGMLHGLRIPQSQTELVYNGTDFASFPVEDPDPVYAEFGIPRDRTLIGMLGLVSPLKGHHLMVEAMAMLKKDHPEAHLFCIGDVRADFRATLDNLIDRYGIRDRVTMTGLRPDIPRLLDAVSFAVMPSDIETFAVAAAEALARGKPVIASRVGALPEIVLHERTGLIVDRNPIDIAEACRRLLQDKGNVLAMGEAAKLDSLARFTAERMAAETLNVYHRALDRKL